MKTLNALIISLFIPALCAAQFAMEKQVLSCGGGAISSAQYEMDGTLAQTATGTSASAGYVVNSGFWTPDSQLSSVCVFGDDFSDLDASDWIPSNGVWSAVTGSLVGTFNKKAENINSSFTGCGASCSVQATMQVQAGASASLIGWYADKKTNVELMMTKSKWILKQKSAGRKVTKGKFKTAIQPDTPYVARIIYDGSSFQVMIDGVVVINVAAGAPANGGIGVRMKSLIKTDVSVTFDDFCAIL